jgi:hypothetical protein
MVMLLIAIWATPIWLTVARRRRNLRMMPAPVQLRLLREGVAVREGIGRVKVCSWEKVWGFEFFKKKDGRQRIRIQWRGRRGPSCELDTDLGEVDAGLVRRRVEEWRVGSGGTR